MLTFREFLKETVEKITAQQFGGGEKSVKLLINPKKVELDSMLKHSRGDELRGMLNKKHLIVWDSTLAMHRQVEDALENTKWKGAYTDFYILLGVGDMEYIFSADGGYKDIEYVETEIPKRLK